MSIATGSTDPIEIFPLAGGYGQSAVVINGTELPSAEGSSESAGAIIPTKTNEKGYDWNYRTGPESIDAEVEGRVNGADLAALKRLRDEKQPFSYASFTTQLPRAHIPEGGLSIETEDGAPGAYSVTLSVVEIQQGQTGQSTIRAVSKSGTKSPKAGSGKKQPGIVSTNGGKNGNAGNAGESNGNGGGSGGGLLSGIGDFAAGLNDQIGNAIGLGPTGGDDR